jgi:hypothetical protein
MQSLQRQQKINYLRGETGDDLALSGTEASVRNTQAQAAYNTRRSAHGDVHYMERKDGAYAIYDDGTSKKIGGIAPEDTDEPLMDYYDPGDPTTKLRLKPSQIAQLKQNDRIASNRPNAQDSAGEEGAATEQLAGRAAAEIQAEIDQLKTGLPESENSIAVKDALWNRRASEIVKADILGETSMAEALAQARAEDPDYNAGTYASTSKSVAEKKARLQVLEKELLDVNKEKRGGAAKSVRGTAKKFLNSDGSPQQFSRAKALPEIAKRWGVSTTEAEKRITDGGGKVY